MIDFDFDLGDDINLLRDSIARFAADKIAPRAAEIDQSNEFPRELWPELGRHEPGLSCARRRRRGN
jgi:isovaleryl-CoA dehydrogenase